ncbi:NrdH-redoxin [Candidatus Micrarchaeota archaeon]|nr:NrdH-redoxin [Candidatus Micrarchaeota archaeon]
MLERNEKPKQKRVIVYTSPSCPYCNMVKEYLSSRGVEFEGADVSLSREKAQEMLSKSGRMGVPQVDINGRIIVGFNQAAIDEALAAR